jgi:tripartite-type tricarboxylate transporter receptor subunit TctC
MRATASMCGLLLGLCLSLCAAAQSTWPTKPIRLILQSPPGGSSDIIARLLQTPLQESLGQPLVIESRPGSFGIPAGLAVARSGSDGYTFGLFATTLAANETMQKELPFNALKDFTAVALVAKTPNMIAVNAATPIHSIQELIAAAKAKPGALSYGTVGLGLTQHMAGEYLKVLAGVDMLHVPYKGAGPAIVAALGGEIPIVITVAGSMAQYVQNGRLRALAVTGNERLGLFPNVPTVAEQGFPGFSVNEWFGIVGPAGLPADVTRRLNAEVNRALHTPLVLERLTTLGFQVAQQSPEQFRALIESDIINLRTIIQAAKISTN